jgi:hypothetical protein
MPELLNPASSKIDPLILQKLQAFADRRRKLIVRRGIYAAAATLVVAMMIVAFLDWVFVLPDTVRWSLSGAAYLAIIVVEWRSCWRLLLRAPGSRQLARLIEHAEPGLREDLLSAVELGDGAEEEIFDSEQFRALVQSNVASRMEKLDMEELLPARLLRRYTLIAIGVGVACLVAFALTGFQFGTLMMRALLPMANFARVSKVKVHIVEPSPAEMRVAQGDTLPLIIELSGQSANKATLETFTPSGGREVVPMTPLARDRFSATIQVGRENVYYRVRAGDALTRKYLLEAVPRPAVVEFRKSYTYPGYSRLASKTVVEENGDLSALEGSQVELRLRTNQKVRDAELRIEQGKTNTVVPLTMKDDALVATLPIKVSGIYRVHLVGAESGFENKFSPEYELRAEPDLVPQVDLDSPKQDLILPSNEIVDIEGSASDDFALAKVAQWVKINDGGWKQTVLATDPGAKTKVERRWDLFDQGVKPGDLVTTKLVATDLKGNRAESRSLQVTITAAGFESKRLQALSSYRQFFAALQNAQAASATLVKQAYQAKQQYERLQDGDPQQKQMLTPVSAALEDLAQKNADVTKQLSATIREASPGHVSGDLDLLGRALIHVQRGGVENARHILGTLESNAGLQSSRELLGEAMNSLVRTEQILRQMVEICRATLTAEEIDVLNENLQVVTREQDRLLTLAHHSGTDAEKWVPVANRMRVVLSELRSLEELAGSVIEHGTHGIPDRMRNLQKLVNKRRTTLETALTGKPGAELLAPTMELSQALTDASRQALDMGRDYRPHTMEILRSLTAEARFSWTNLEQLREDNGRLQRNTRLPVEVSNALLEARWAAHLDSWKNRGDIEEWRPDSDSFFVSDLRLTTRILQALHDRVIGERVETWNKDLLGIDQNFRVLECGHMLSELVDGTTHLAAGERWELYNPRARTTNPHDWAWLGERLRALPEEIGRALDFNERRQLAQDALKILREAANQEFTRNLQREMDERFTFGREPQSARDSVEELAAWLRQALDLFRQPMEDARKTLAEMAPTLADTMKQLAKKTEDLHDKTTNQAQQAQEKLPDEAKAEARKALAEQQQLNQQVEALKDSLRADANKQNVLEKEGRERARDADDALAMLKEPPQRAEEDLELAAKSDKAATQEQALTQAAEQQAKLTQALQQMADHYAEIDKGKPEETRAAMRATEQQNGVKEQLDQQYAKMEQMAKMAQSTPEEMLAQLEKALPQNPQMQKELSGISQNILQGAAEQLKQASSRENNVAQNIQKMAADEKAQSQAQAQATAAQQPNNPNQANANPAQAQAPSNTPNQPNPSSPANAAQANATPNGQAQNPPQGSAQPPANANTPPNSANQPQTAGQQAPKEGQPAANNPALNQPAQEQTPIARTASQVADDVMRAGRHETRLDNKVAGEQLQQLGEQVAANAQQEVPNAQQSLQKAQQAAQAEPAVDAANAGLKKSLEQLAGIADPAQASASEQPPAHSQAQESTPAGAPAQAEAKPNAGQDHSAPIPSGNQPMSQAQAQAAQHTKMGQQSENGQANGQGQKPPTAQNGENAPNAAAAQASQAAQAAAQMAAQAPGKNGQQPPASAPAATPGQQAQKPPGAAPDSGENPISAAPVSPQEQVWMARTLDALDAALHGHTPGDEQQQAAASGTQQAQSGSQQAQGNAQASQRMSQSAQTSAASNAGAKAAPQSAMAQAQSAMQQAAAAAARQSRQDAGSPSQAGQQQQGSLQAKSEGGSPSDGGRHGALGEAKNKPGDWGKLPKQMAEQLSQGQQEGMAGEYRNQVETYYRVIAEKSKKP